MNQASQVRIIVFFKFNKAVNAELYKQLTGFTKTARLEPGCTQIDLMEDLDHPEAFSLVETWESMDAWEAHSQTPCFKEFVSLLALNTTSFYSVKLKFLAV